ncbi:hypothetical protein [Microbacterium sp.]|uniref:hypothetical protein n=1 Tax=Microbacterium sp. TaxID=51671 RepID=UPI0028124CA3|nr:hypothetical protein [Microbacterium sp.]
MTDTAIPLKRRPLTTDEELRALLELLTQRANRRQMWLLFIDDRGCLGDPIMPMADYPRDPHTRTTAEDLGEVTEAGLLMQRAGLLCGLTGNVEIVLMWERVGSRLLRTEDRAWAAAMHRAAVDFGVTLRAQFLLHSGGVRLLGPGEYL